MRRYLVGGVLMGFGGLLAGGCAVRAGLSGAAIFAITCWVTLCSLWAAAALTDRVIDDRPATETLNQATPGRALPPAVSPACFSGLNWCSVERHVEHKTASSVAWRRCKSARCKRASLWFSPSQTTQSFGFLKFHIAPNTALAPATDRPNAAR